MDYPEDGFLFLQDMQWRTEINKIDSDFKITHQTKLITLGSCFSDTIGNKFLEFKFPVTINPFGTMFNPLSIARLFNGKKNTDKHLICSNDIYYHLDFHSSICSDNKNELVTHIDKLQDDFLGHVNQSDVIFITLGSAYVYEFIETKQVIANCHKLPSVQFKKRLLSVEEIVESFSMVITSYPEKHFVFTVSPVRHTKEGLSENMLSKSVLRVAVGQLCSQVNASYFPSFEIMIDDLRDYRYYTDDLIHINKQGEEYIWDFLQKSYCTEETSQLIKKVGKLQKKISHRSFNANSEEYHLFLKGTLIDLELANLEVDFSSEIISIKRRINERV